MNYKQALIKTIINKTSVNESKSETLSPHQVDNKLCGFNDIVSCTIPNCLLHQRFCQICQCLTQSVKVFKLHPHYDAMSDCYVPESADYINDYVCLSCFPNLSPNDPYNNSYNNTLIHHIKCYTEGWCRCNDYYCSVKDCTRFCRNRNQRMHGPSSNMKESKCRGHEMFCIHCQKETFWIIKHTFKHQIKDSSKDYVCTSIECGPCYGYKCSSRDSDYY